MVQLLDQAMPTSKIMVLLPISCEESVTVIKIDKRKL